jgi:hypothetical protein
MHRLLALAVVVVVLAAGHMVSSPDVEAENEFIGNIPSSGIALGIWSGGDVNNVGSAVAAGGCELTSIWTASTGQFVPFIPGAPEVVNAAFLDTFEGSTIPPNTPLVIVCAAESAGEPAGGPPPAISPPEDILTFGDGVHAVGSDVQPGRYRTTSPSGLCYWARLSGFGGTLDELIANDLAFGGASEVVDIDAADLGFESDGCGTWSTDLSAVTTSPEAPFGDGTYIVGVDVAAGTWRSAGGETCYWSRLAGFGGELGDILANDLPDGPTVVTIAPSDVGFTTSGCGEWAPA